MISEIPEQLKKIEDNRALILLVESMGFLHDIGKLSKKLFTTHYKRYDEDVENKLIPPILREIFDIDLKNLLKDILPEESIEKLGDVKIKGFQRHHTGERKEYWPKNWIEEIINLSDDKDSSEDRGKAIAEQEEFKASVFGKEEELKKEEFEEKRKELYKYLTIVFSKLLDFNSRGKVMGIKKNADWKEFHKGIIKAIEVFKEGVASTYRSSNDVTLYDHSYMTGSIAKALVGKAIIENSIERFSQQIIRIKAEEDLKNPNLPREEKEVSKKILNEIKSLEHFDKECDLDLLMASFDGFGFISGGVNLLDVRGRKKVLEEIKESVKNLLEVKYSVGNCIYEDENNLCFLVTPLENKSLDYLKEEIYEIFNERTSGILASVIDWRKNLKYYGKDLIELKKENEKSVKENVIKDFIPGWIEEWKNAEGKEKCIICGKLPQWEGKESDYLCRSCWKLRYEVKEKREEEDSPWIDEIADENGRIAVIVGRFNPIDRWISGDFLKYQRIKTFADLRESPRTKEYFQGINDQECENILKRAVDNFIEILIRGTKEKSILNKKIHEKLRDEKESSILGGGSKVGEFYWRLSEEQRKNIEKGVISDKEKEKENISMEIRNISTTKPPSPSRLYRIWRELEDSSRDIIKKFRAEITKGKRLKFSLKGFKGETGIYNAIIPGIGRIEVFYDGENEEFSTIERIDINEASDESIRTDGGDFLKKHIEFEKTKEKLRHDKIEVYKDDIKKRFFEIKDVDFEDYKQFREVLISPNGFLFVIPANKMLSIVKSRNEFNKKFSKVLGNISLNIGVIFSYRKFPIYITVDCARRLIDEFNSFEFEEVEVCGKRGSLIKLKIDDKGIEMNISDKLGDGKEDLYYPYLLTPNGDMKHIKDVKAGEKLKLILSRFDFEFLDSSSRRFNMLLNKNKRREHSIFGENGPRPYLLEDLERIIDLWSIMNKKLTHSQIKNLEYLCASKIKEWDLIDVIGNDTISKEGKEKLEIFNEFVKSSIENICGELSKDKREDREIKEEIRQSIFSGMFFDVIELFMGLRIKSLSPFDAIALALGDFQYTKEERRKAEEWLLEQVRKDPDWKNYLEVGENANS